MPAPSCNKLYVNFGFNKNHQIKQVDTEQARRDLGEKHDDQQQSVRVDQTLAFLPGSTTAEEGHAEDDAA